MTTAELAILDLELHGNANKPMNIARAREWIGKLTAEVVQLQQGVRSIGRVLNALRDLVEHPETKATAIQLLREHGMLPLEKKEEPPLNEKRKEFMDVWRSTDAEGKKKLEDAVRAADDKVLLARIEEAKV